MSTDSRKQSIYLPAEMLREIQAEAQRLDRSLSWVVQFAWQHGGLQAVRRIPSLSEVAG